MVSRSEFHVNVENYNNVAETRHWSPVVMYNDSVLGYWWFGRWYNQTRVDGDPYFYGAYPAKFLERVEALMYPIFEEGMVLHLFSGSLKGNGENIFTLDIQVHNICPECGALLINEECSKCDYGGEGMLWRAPDIIADAAAIPIMDNTFDLILADPPYEDNWKKYGTKRVKKRKTLQECHRVLKPGGWLLWLDTIIPQWRKTEFQYRGVIAVQPSTNRRTRTLLFLQKV